MTEIAPERRQRELRVAAAVSLLLCAVFAALLTSSLPQDVREQVTGVGFALGGLGIVVSGSVAARRCAGRRRRAWALLVAAALVAVAGNLVSSLTGADPVTDPSLVGDLVLIVALLLSVVGLLGLGPARVRGAALVVMVLDGVVMGAAALVVVGIAVYPRVDGAAAGDGLHRAASLAFPLLDVALATVAMLLITRSRGSRTFFLLVGVGFLLYAVADLVFMVEVADGRFTYGTPSDLGWILGYGLMTVSAWHPDATAPSQPEEGHAQGSDVWGSLLVFSVLAGAVAVQIATSRDEALNLMQAAVWMLLIAGVAARQVLLTADNARLRHGLEDRVREQTADLRRLARETEVLLSSVGDGIIGVDLQGRIRFVNPSAARALGRPAETLLGAPVDAALGVVDTDDPPADRSYVDAAFRSGSTTGAEDVYSRPDGSTFPVEVTASPLRDEEQITGAVLVFRDVTQRREVDRMKNEFLSVVSHELRTPLTAIRGSLGLLAGGGVVELTAPAERLVERAVESSERLSRLINDLLDVERIQSGRLPMTVEVHETSDLLRAVAAEMRSLAATSGVRIEVDPEAAGTILVDADRIVQTLTNLVGNAVKFSDPDGVVRLGAVQDGSEVVVSVRDHGRGIPEDKLEAVFEPFQQVDSSDARDKGGTGLGLAISRGIVQQHGGRIWAEATPGGGATLRFALPCAAAFQRG